MSKIFFYLFLVLELILNFLILGVNQFGCSFRNDTLCFPGIASKMVFGIIIVIGVSTYILKINSVKNLIIISLVTLFIIFLPWTLIWLDSPLLPKLIP